MSPPPPNRSPRGAWAAAGAFAAAILAVGWWYWRPAEAPPPTGPTPDVGAISAGPAPPPPPDLRATFDTPFRNVRPEVEYVGDDSCAKCHEEITRSYRAHPMGRSAAVVGRGPEVERFDPASHNPFAHGPYRVKAERTPEGGMTHRVSAEGPDGKPLPGAILPVEVAIGSGTRGRSYLFVRDGAVVQTALSWYANGARWDFSPGYDRDLGAKASWPITGECLFCHVNRAEPIPGAVNRFREPLVAGHATIGCERCHGPGSLHAAERANQPTAPNPDYTIANPKRMPPDLAADVCRQCHLQGAGRVQRFGRDVFDYRPGLPWEQYVATFLRRPDRTEAHRSVGQFEELERSKCFTGSGGSMGCTACHDPHRKPAPEAAAAHYRQRCLTCHQSRGCSLSEPDRAARGNDCTACHMPKAASANIAHTAVSDHRIPRRPDDVPPVAAGGPGLPVVPYRAGPHAPPADERERDMALMLVRIAGNPGSPLARAAESRLAAAVRRSPGDVDAWVGLAGMADWPRAVPAAATAAALAPNSEAVKAVRARLAFETGDHATAVEVGGELIRANPSSVEYREARALSHLFLRRWADADADARAALDLYPYSRTARLCLAVARYRQGDAAGGRRESDAALGLMPTDEMKDQYRHWLANFLR